MFFSPAPQRRRTWAAGGALWLSMAGCGGLLAGVVASRGGTFSLLLVATGLVVVMTVWRPAWVLFGGLFVGLVDPTLHPAAAASGPVLVVGGLTAFVMFASGSMTRTTRRVAVPYIVLLLVLGIGVLTSGNAAPLRLLVVVLATVALSMRVSDHHASWRLAGGIAAAGFAAVSLLLGETSATGLRWAGVSGNPNRMVFGLLLALALSAWLMSRRSGSRTLRVMGVATAMACIAGISLSGSAQGLVGLAALAIMAAAGWALRRGRAGRRAAVLILSLAGAALGVAFLSTSTARLSYDLESLSGRSAIFAAGVRQFLQAPFLGSGQFRVTDIATGERSSHNSLISIAIAGGVVCLVLWAWMLLDALRTGLVSIAAGDWSGLCAMAVLTTQLVQQVEFLPITWATLFLVASQRRNLPASAPRPRPPVVRGVEPNAASSSARRGARPVSSQGALR